MPTVLNVLLIILTIVIVLLAVLYFVGRKLQKKQAVQQEQMEAAKQTVSMLVIDKKKMKMKDSGLPQMVLDSTPKLMRRTKLPIVKAKVGPRIMTFIADARFFEMIPVKKEIKATISGLYITDVKACAIRFRGSQGKEGFFKRMKNKVTGKNKKAETASDSKARNPAQKPKSAAAPAPQKQAAAKNTANASGGRNPVLRKRRESKKSICLDLTADGFFYAFLQTVS